MSPHSFCAEPVTEVVEHSKVQRSASNPSVLPDNADAVVTLSEGPFAGLPLPYQTAKANAAYITRRFVSTYLITHPHLDHLSGFAVNTASFQHTYRPKCLAGLPSTIDAVKDHIFNDVIWPNLSDEDGGVGLVTYMRLVEGGNVALGTGDGMGYIEVCDGLGVKCWSVSHGHCMKRHSHRGSSTGAQAEVAAHVASGRKPLRSSSTDNLGPVRGQQNAHPSHKACVYDSSAFFIRDHSTGAEVLIFGDVEPDSISLSPRTAQVWQDAAPKIAAGLLKGIFIECSYDDSQSDETLFGHLCPRHLVAELQVLAANVVAAKRAAAVKATNEAAAATDRKRKRQSNGLKMSTDPEIRARRSRNPHRLASSSVSTSPGLSQSDSAITSISTWTPDTNTDAHLLERPLQDLKVIIIHMKDTLSDGPDIGETILSQLLEYEKEARLGCTFIISQKGTSVWL